MGDTAGCASAWPGALLRDRGLHGECPWAVQQTLWDQTRSVAACPSSTSFLAASRSHQVFQTNPGPGNDSDVSRKFKFTGKGVLLWEE